MSKILITHCWLSGFGGAEINILQLTKYLISVGHEVNVFTYWYEGEMVDEFEKIGVKVMVDRFDYLDTKDKLEYTDMSINEYDIIWVCQQVIPISIIRQINLRTTTKFIFLHMSSLIGIPVEAPIIYKLEEKIASKILVISEETLEDNLGRFMDKKDSRIGYYRNPVPVEFRYINKDHSRLKKIAVITNHPAKEIIELSGKFENRGIEVEYIGSWNNNYRLVDSNVLKEFDLIIGIGKNVQYCLVSGIPVYVYDYFGGPGFLNSKNYNRARHYNFSGRGFDRKTSDEIIEDIINGYDKYIKFYNKNSHKYVEEYSIDKVVSKIITNLPENLEHTHLSKKYINYVISMQILLHDRFLSWGGNKINGNKIKRLQGELDAANRRVRELDNITKSRKKLIKEFIKRF